MSLSKSQCEAVADRRQLVVVLTREGWTANAIAERLNVTPRTVFRDRQRMKISRPKSKPWTDDEHRRAQQLIADGYSLMEVARTLHRHVNTISDHGFKGQGWTAEQTGQYNALRKWEKRVFG